MKRNILLIILIMITIVGSGFANGKSEEKDDRKILKVGTEGTYKPYSYHNEEGLLIGYDVEVIEAIADYLGYEIEFSESRWDGLLAGLTSKRWDVVANQVWWNESRAQEYLLSNKYLLAGASVIVKADNVAVSSLDLKDKKAAVSLTSSFRPYVEALTSDIEFQDDFQLAVELLSSGRVDFVVNDTQAIGQYLQENPNSELKALVLEGAKTTEVVFALGKDKDELLKEINDALQALHADGTIDAIHQKYFAGVK